MSPVSAFKLILLSFLAIVALEYVAKRLRLPPAAALLVGGIGIAFIPGLPPINLDPDLVLVVFLPPLLMDGAYFSVWQEFKRNVGGILLLAIGAVAFTTFAVGVAVHWAVPSLPWAACFALGAIVSPPDAVAAKAVLERVALPRRLMVLLEGESLLNDAAGLVLFRFAVAAALTGAFSLQHAVVGFAELGLGGVVVGFVIGRLVVWFLKLLDDDYLVITVAVLAGWIAYIAGEMVEVSGVIATVTAGMIVGWHQHEVFSAAVRTRGTAFWQVIVFLLEALVFVLIGLSLRGAMLRLGGLDQVLATMLPPVGAVLAAVVLSRFVWIYAVEALKWPVRGIMRRGDGPDWKAATVMSWAGMRGVVTLAIALSLPDAMPGRDVILVAAFAVILVTVLLQGTTIGPLIRLLRLPQRHERAAHHLSEPQAWARVEAAQLAAIQPLVRDENGVVIHPRLLEQYTYRAALTERLKDEPEFPASARTAHYDVVLAAIAAGRAELLRLHRTDRIHDEMLHALERDLDLQEVAAYHARG
ncbi:MULTISPECIES: Na+/H+ antiporter [Burkholderia]|uniref:Na+/H+ antiporter n=1 Tax=Burkholderia TaxID=32008 RepID=UPI00080B6CD0|nr:MULTISPECIES: Na+/H+ antiporter [Burkholderia]MDR9050612.1 Sodium, potassium, lithium and rubidium/H(+) antiporter [Burkholderia multivorans]MDR9057225.1 Sodium, potassium, lithium and rubidium/H(+) antiporter [Burkholderia multivorans]MDR9063797.1 Sodium, potassium, lithium and rubidium/H(+) antiporter [Burkholderia multivorans]MDR9068009.1 Sodium, potassium, lithium and rubidium/H(+) antiporter [Burkholderia multivorans]MDR9075393.1 Sodium, potassium, lithium and rubidium/H(+) antiporter 